MCGDSMNINSSTASYELFLYIYVWQVAGIYFFSEGICIKSYSFTDLSKLWMDCIQIIIWELGDTRDVVMQSLRNHGLSSFLFKSNVFWYCSYYKQLILF
jgi:hypothetical protein